MKIYLTKLTNDRHALEIVRRDGTRDRAELETKSLWLHDLVHFAVESEAGLQDGFYGLLAAGKTMAEMNDRSGEGLGAYSGTMLTIETLVGALSGALNGVPLEAVITNIRGYLESVGKGDEFPGWLSPEYLERVRERLRKLVGHWNGTPFGSTMEIQWPE